MSSHTRFRHTNATGTNIILNYVQMCGKITVCVSTVAGAKWDGPATRYLLPHNTKSITNHSVLSRQFSFSINVVRYGFPCIFNFRNMPSQNGKACCIVSFEFAVWL